MPSVKAPNLDISKDVALATKALAPAAKRLEKALAMLDPAKIPTGALADALYDLKALGKLLNSITAPFDDFLPATVKTIEDYFINTLEVGESSGVQGYLARVQVTTKPVPVIKPENWIKFWTYVAKTKQWDLLQRKVSSDAVRERWDNKKQVKFVDVFNAKSTSCTKLSVPKGRNVK
jgi:hypothetical protein